MPAAVNVGHTDMADPTGAWHLAGQDDLVCFHRAGVV